MCVFPQNYGELQRKSCFWKSWKLRLEIFSSWNYHLLNLATHWHYRSSSHFNLYKEEFKQNPTSTREPSPFCGHAIRSNCHLCSTIPFRLSRVTASTPILSRLFYPSAHPQYCLVNILVSKIKEIVLRTFNRIFFSADLSFRTLGIREASV